MSVSNCCISQGSVATYLRCGGIITYVLLEISFSLQQYKNFWNRLRFDKVIAKVRDHSFFGTQCTILSLWQIKYVCMYLFSGKNSWNDLEARLLHKELRYSCSRSFKVIDIGTNRKPIRDFLLVFHYNKIFPYFYRFRDRTILLVESRRFFAVVTHPSLVWRPCKGVPWDLGLESWYQKIESLG